MRSIKDQYIATGSVALAKGTYSMHGPYSVFDIKHKIPRQPPVECCLWQFSTMCAPSQQEAVLNGTALVHDYIVVQPKS